MFRKNIPQLTIVFGFALFCLLDILNFDRFLYGFICNFLGRYFETNCTNYYDIPIWSALSSFGTLVAIVAVWSARNQGNKQLEVEQTPYLVIKDRITTNSAGRLHLISLKNIGRGMATNITATTDPEGEISIIEGSNPHSIDLGSGEYNNGWAVDENRAKEGLKKQGKNINGDIITQIPDEEFLLKEEKSKAEFFLYLWYNDQVGHKYKTVTTIRHAGNFLKVMQNNVTKIS